MSCLTCGAANTTHTQRNVTSHCTCTRSPITHHLSWKTSQIPSTNGFQKYHRTENALTMPKPCTKKPSIKAVTLKTCLKMCLATRNSSQGRTIQETFFGTIHLSARMSTQMLESASFLSLINTSLNQTLFTKCLTGTRLNWAIVAWQISKPLYPTTTKPKSTNLIPPMTAIVTARTQACAPWTENATTRTWSTKPRSWHQPQRRHTLVFPIQHLNLDTETMYAHFRTSGISMPLN